MTEKINLKLDGNNETLQRKGRLEKSIHLNTKQSYQTFSCALIDTAFALVCLLFLLQKNALLKSLEMQKAQEFQIVVIPFL